MTKARGLEGFSTLQSTSNSGGMLAVPVGLMRFLRKGMLFKPELTEDGILYRFVEPEPKPVVVPPRWAAPKPEGQ